MAVLPARVKKPRDKAKAEVAVQVVERWVLAALRHRTFFSLAELNAAIAKLLERLNARPFRKLPGARRASTVGWAGYPARREWRTREDPFEEVWPEVEGLLEADAGLQAKTVFEELGRRYPGRFREGQLRTLQRRFRDWKALRGAAREVYFAQRHHPGEQSQSDFTDLRTLGVSIAWTYPVSVDS